jgi:putative SOS response-associated peptidase YedK
MCGRYQLLEALQLLLPLDMPPVPKFKNHYNIAPHQKSWIIRLHDGKPAIDEIEWGFRPSWLKDKNKAQINARGETIFSKPMFKHSAKNRRCLILSSGWYEWQITPKGKQPYRFCLKDSTMFAFAGVWTTWHADGTESQDTDSYAIVTTEATSAAASIHPRMPVILSAMNCEYWLDTNAEEKHLVRLLSPYGGRDLRAYPVSNYVNNPKNTESKCIEPLRA